MLEICVPIGSVGRTSEEKIESICNMNGIAGGTRRSKEKKEKRIEIKRVR